MLEGERVTDWLPQVATLVDLDRYPIHDLDGARAPGTLVRGKAKLYRFADEYQALNVIAARRWRSGHLAP